MSDTLRQVIGGVPRDQIEHDVYDGRMQMGHWLAAWADAEALRRQNEARQSIGLLPVAVTPGVRMPQDEEAAGLLALAEGAGTVPAEAAAAYRDLIEARALAEPGADPTEADAARVRERYGVVHAWLEAQAS